MRRSAWLAAIASVLLRVSAGAAPLPPERPRGVTESPAAVAPLSSSTAAGSIKSAPQSNLPTVSPTDCLARLQAHGVAAEPATIVSAEGASCTIETPVRLKAFAVEGGRTVLLPDDPVLACVFAEPLTDWLRDLAAPLVAARIAPMKAVRTGPGFACRNRNHQAQGRLSAHAVGLAIDVAGFELSDGSTLSVTEAKDSNRIQVLSTLRKAGCGWFTTILGPGSDEAHATHWHLDIMKHGQSGSYRTCE